MRRCDLRDYLQDILDAVDDIERFNSRENLPSADIDHLAKHQTTLSALAKQTI